MAVDLPGAAQLFQQACSSRPVETGALEHRNPVWQAQGLLVSVAQRPRSISLPIRSQLRCWKPANWFGSRPPTASLAIS